MSPVDPETGLPGGRPVQTPRSKENRRKRRRTWVWSTWYSAGEIAALAQSPIAHESGVFHIRDRRSQETLLIDAARAKNMVACIRRRFRSRVDPLYAEVRMAIIPEGDIPRILRLVRRHDRRESIPLETWSDWLPVDPVPALEHLPSFIFGVYRIARGTGESRTICYIGKSEHCVRRRVLRHFQEPYVNPQNGEVENWFAEERSGFCVSWMRTRQKEARRHELYLIQEVRPCFNRDLMVGQTPNLPFDNEDDPIPF